MEEDSLFRSFKVAYYFSKIFGAMPFRIEKTYSTSISVKSKWCRMGVVFSLIYIGLVITAMIATQKASHLTKFRGTKLTSIHDRTQTIVAPMFLWSVLLSQICVAASFVALPFQLSHLNDVFSRFRQLINSAEGALLFGNEVNIEKMVKNVRTNTTKIILLYVFLAISSAVSSFDRIRLSPQWTFFFMVDVITKKMEALSLCIAFCALCDILLHFFRFINEILDSLKCKSNRERFPFLDEIISPTRAADTVKALNFAHRQLCDLLDRVNRVYQVQNLIGITVCTLKMLPHLFLTGIILTYSNFRILHSSFFLWPAQYMYRIFILCESATKLTVEAKRTFIHVSSLYDKEESIDENTRQERKIDAIFQLISFLNRINNRSIRFLLCGLCNLDNEYFVTNLMTVSGYFIIILQSYMTLIESWPTEISSEFESQP